MKGVKVALLLCIALTCACAAKIQWDQVNEAYTFDQYISDFGKSYTNTNEYQMRKSIFEANRNKIIAHNKDDSKTWKESVNRFADRTAEEFQRLLGYDKNAGYARKSAVRSSSPLPKVDLKDIPTSMDWRVKGVVTPVKDQLDCGSCWAFGSAETLESAWAIAKGNLIVLSEQQILDCTPNPNHCGGTGGCGGGTPELAYAAIANITHGLATEKSYPYKSGNGQNFKCHSATPVAFVQSYVELPSNEYTPLLNAIATVGPIAISVDANAWQFYSGGVFNGCDQKNPDIDHVVQLVGYGTDSKTGKDFWLVRNSWNADWGEDGYIRVFRTATQECGTDKSPGDGTGCDNGPKTVTVCGTCGILYDSVYPIVAAQ